MLLIPAIDLKNGQCVRLRQGRMDDVTVFSSDPAATAKRWVDEGAQRLHVVDLDGAVQGRPVNLKALERIVAAVGNVPVEAGGGVRDEDAAQHYIDAGVEYVIIGTKAVNTPHFLHNLCLQLPRRVIVSLDAKDGRVAVNGWSRVSRVTALDAARHCERDGVEAIVYTDISRDGMMGGFNAEATAELARNLTTPVIASGGISGPADLERLKAIEGDGVMGCIVGRALYEGNLSVAQCVKILA
ncbi:MAG: 1-(5-phosphoribosyl)-5-[(5-phosphoribosylamino)methylideneamino]imidazole-4-carboxamide isomerase [Nevskiaceae bacterium]|nr:MAG: 1-(5-phosphoribosyl)-5-[(5-phosphoribosylamino)methylideneamino]imidazole-4-carboxamide isomerase [Nevskiaceae bacterium]TBR71636.1 MAG: 1-(5-phosphoribosyl)-5-[(5-phosphoribosylamino)methylideneamino]imidazole-4-carboxamide isomerase [Nevskiaceae bacterium]